MFSYDKLWLRTEEFYEEIVLLNVKFEFHKWHESFKFHFLSGQYFHSLLKMFGV